MGDVDDGRLSVLALDLYRRRLNFEEAVVGRSTRSLTAGASNGAQLAAPNRASVFARSDGLHASGSALAEGIEEVAGPDLALGGGFAGDGDTPPGPLVGDRGRAHSYNQTTTVALMNDEAA